MGAGIFKLAGKGLSYVLGSKTGKVLALGGAAYATTAVTGKGLITIGTGAAKNILLDKEEREKGAIKGLYRQLADTSLGEGTADVIDQKAGEVPSRSRMPLPVLLVPVLTWCRAVSRD